MRLRMWSLLRCCGLLAAVGIPLCGAYAAGERDVRMPPLDAEGRFWVYRDGLLSPPLPFTPYGIMPEAGSKMLFLDPDCTFRPEPTTPMEDQEAKCFAVRCDWKAPWWCGVAWISGPDTGPDGEAWWGEDNRGWYYDLSKLSKLSFCARGDRGGERIQVKLGILCDKRWGDSLRYPLETRWLQLTKEWQTFTIDLTKRTAAERAAICNGFTLVLNNTDQPDREVTRVYLDTIYYQ